MGKIFLIGLLLSVLGCAHKPIIDSMVYNSINPELKAVDFEKDKKLCRYEAAKYGLSGYGGGGSAFDSMMAIEANKINLVNQCMDVKGWVMR